MRDRLIELLGKELMDYASWQTEMALAGNYNMPSVEEVIADKLLENGVDIPFCKVGRVVYTIENCIKRPEKLIVTAVHQYEKYTSITALSKGQKEYFYEDKDFDVVVFFSKEEAEQALKGGGSDD